MWFGVTKPPMTGNTVVKTFNELLRRPVADSDPAHPTAFDILDERYEVLDSGAFWDETAEVLDPAGTRAG